MNYFCLYIINMFTLVFTSPKSMCLSMRCIHAFEWFHFIVYIEIVQFNMSHPLNSIRNESNNLFMVYFVDIVNASSFFVCRGEFNLLRMQFVCWFNSKCSQLILQKTNKLLKAMTGKYNQYHNNLNSNETHQIY